MLRRGKPNTSDASSRGSIFDDLRSQALSAVTEGLSDPTPDHPEVSGVVVDIPAEGGFATVVALTDNTTSLYTSTGGGTIGAGEHAAVATLTHQTLAVVQAHLGLFRHPDDGALPPPGSVRLHVLTPSGGRMADVDEECFWGRAPSELMPVIASVQSLITAIREVSQ